MMFGGAIKKNIIRDILKQEATNVSGVNTTAEVDSKSSNDDHSVSITDTSSDSETETETETATASESESESASESESDICVATLGTTNSQEQHHYYAFADNELEYQLDEFAESHPDVKEYKLVIYQINANPNTPPFLEFLLYHSKIDHTDNHLSVCQFPYYQHHQKLHIRNETDAIMNKLFTRKYRYKGYFYREDQECYVFYEVRYVNKHPELLSLRDHWHWVTTPEIIYYQKYVNLPIDVGIVDLFHIYPTIGILQSTTVVRERRNRRAFAYTHIELPTILYYGSDICYAENTARYGLKREPIVSRYGPFYYFTTLEKSFYWACYHFPTSHQTKDADSKKIRKSVNGGISRYAVFTKRMKTVFVDDDFDVDDVKKFVERKNVFQPKINEHRNNQEEYSSGDYDSVYSYGYEWTENYDTIYNGYYHINAPLLPVWCVCDHNNFTLLSYYEVKMVDGASSLLPALYDSEFTKYNIL
jgi:hypothetical protein